MVYIAMSSSEQLATRFARMTEWQSVDGFIDLLRKIVLSMQEGDPDDRGNLRALIARVENRIIELTRQKVDELVNDFEDFNPLTLKRERNLLLQMAPDAPTKRLNKFFMAQSWKIKDRLDKGSRELAEYFISIIENALGLVEEILASTNQEREIRCMRANLDGAEGALHKIDRMPHVKFVGIKLAAQKRQVTSDALLAGYMARYEAANTALAFLEAEAVEKERLADAKALEERRGIHRLKERSLEEQRTTFTRQQTVVQIEQAVAAIERRNEKAGKAARQFLAHLALNNTNAAWASLGEIRNLDGGVPKLLQDEYHRIASKTS